MGLSILFARVRHWCMLDGRLLHSLVRVQVHHLDYLIQKLRHWCVRRWILLRDTKTGTSTNCSSICGTGKTRTCPAVRCWIVLQDTNFGTPISCSPICDPGTSTICSHCSTNCQTRRKEAALAHRRFALPLPGQGAPAAFDPAASAFLLSVQTTAHLTGRSFSQAPDTTRPLDRCDASTIHQASGPAWRHCHSTRPKEPTAPSNTPGTP